MISEIALVHLQNGDNSAVDPRHTVFSQSNRSFLSGIFTSTAKVHDMFYNS